MFPIIWRYLLQGFLKVFILSVSIFVSVLIVSRFKEIARFAALSGNWGKTALFVIYQIPFILPLAIPISALVSSFLLFHRLSTTYELIALRSSGIGLRSLMSPLAGAAFLLACFNLSCCADISPYCWRQSKALLYHETSENPLLLMQRQNLIKLKNAYLSFKPGKQNSEAKKFVLILLNEKTKRLQLVTAKHLTFNGQDLSGSDCTILQHLNREQGGWDPLILENQKSISLPASVLSSLLKKHRPRLEPNALNTKMLLLRIKECGQKSQAAKVEIARRIYLAASVFTFTLLGAAFGMQPSRSFSKKRVIIVFFLSLFALMAFLGLKSIKTNTAYLLITAMGPHLIILVASCIRIRSASRGVP